MGASHEDLQLRGQQLSRVIGDTFFYDGNAAPRTTPTISATSRFPEQELFICPDLSPLTEGLQAVNQAMVKVAVKDASQEACVSYYDTVGKLLRLLTNRASDVHLFNRTRFEATFDLKWVQ
jgi:hypothetical protein